MGRRELIARSVFGYPYRISLGDAFSENPFYNPVSNTGEILATAAWVMETPQPLVLDIGGHCGFIASQLAMILKENGPRIYSIEPVPPTFSDLVRSIDVLGLNSFIHPISIALSEKPGFVRLNYSRWKSMLAQVVPDNATSNNRSGEMIYVAPAHSLDELVAQVGVPNVIKIDVEGSEVSIFRGGSKLLASEGYARTGVCLEWNPEALTDMGCTPRDLAELMPDRRFFYINDYEGQRLPPLTEIKNLVDVHHTCNLFSIHQDSSAVQSWMDRVERLRQRYNVQIS